MGQTAQAAATDAVQDEPDESDILVYGSALLTNLHALDESDRIHEVWAVSSNVPG